MGKRTALVLVLLLILSTSSTFAFSYTVQSGDSLWKLSQRHGVPITQIKATNGLKSDLLRVGQVLEIPTLAPWEVDLLARLISAEARGEPYAGQVAVAAVVFNRMADPRFPSTLYSVIHQPYQFSPVLDGTINRPATSSAYRAVNDVLAGWDPSYGALGFYNPRLTSNRWVRQQPPTTTIGNHIFFYIR